MIIFYTLLFLALSLLGDILTTKLAISAGAVESNSIYGANPNMTLLIGTHMAAFLIAIVLLYADANIAPLVWGATAGMGLVCLWNIGVWWEQKRSK